MTAPIGARSATGRQHGGLRWLPWLLLLILAIVIAAVVLLVVNVDDDDTATADRIGATPVVVHSPATLVA